MLQEVATFVVTRIDENTNVKTEAVAEPAVEAEEDSKSKCHVRAK